jgi:RNase H-fold protein (predicted Holliday junction resolvase)
MSKRSTLLASRDTDSDDDGGDGAAGEDDERSGSSPRASVVPHAKRAIKAVMKDAGGKFAMAGERSIIEVPELRRKRLNEGYYGDDGLPVPRGVKDDGTADPDSAYGQKYIDDRILRERILEKEPYYRFFVSVAGKKALEKFIDEGASSAETAARIRQAKLQFGEARRNRIDSAGEQARLKSLDDQAEAAASEADRLAEARDRFDTARKVFVESMRKVNDSYAPSIPDRTPTHEGIFDWFTRVACARYGAGGYRKTSTEVSNIADILHQSTLTEMVGNPADAANAKQLQQAMPISSTLALYWSALFIVSQNSILLERLRACAIGNLFPDQSADYNQPTPVPVLPAGGARRRRGGDEDDDVDDGDICKGADRNMNSGASVYADDIVALANLVFDNAQSVGDLLGTNNLLTLEQISQLFWAHVNKMLERAKSKQPALAKPTNVTDQQPPRGGSTTKVVSGIEVQFEISDEDARVAAAGEEVEGVSQELLAAARRKFYRNQDRARSAQVLVELLRPMFLVCFPAFFYANEATFDDGYDIEAFAGGYTGNSLQVFSEGVNNPSHLALVALFTLSDVVVRYSVIGRQPVRKADANQLLSIPAPPAPLLNALDRVMTLSDDVRNTYLRRVTGRLLRRLRVIEAFAQYAIHGSAINVVDAFTKSELEALTRYSELAVKNMPATTRNKKEFVPAENNAASIFASSKPISADRLPVLTDDFTRLRLAEIAKLTQLTQSERYLYVSANRNYDRRLNTFNNRVIDLRRRAQELRDEWRLLHDRMLDIERRTEAEHDATIEKILRSKEIEYTPTGSVAMNPLNSGVLILTKLAKAALRDAFQHVSEYIPCILTAYPTDDDLVESDDYYVVFARLVRIELRTANTDDPDIYLPDATEARTKVARKSALNSLRSIARDDRAVHHYEDARCTCFGFGQRAGSGRSGLSNGRNLSAMQRGL